MKRCLTQDLILQYAKGQCTEAEKRMVDEHVAGCRRCHRRVERACSQDDASAGDCSGPSTLPAGEKNQSGAQRQAQMPTQSMPDASADSFDKEGSGQLAETTIEGYQIVQELPAGGQAVVYKALHKATRSKVALKVLLPSLTASAKARRYFRQEVELAASLNHPNIVAIRDSGVTHGQYYFAMEYIHGQPLDRYVQGRVLAVKEKMALFLKICDAMSHAHQRGVIHRDLKPSNILVDERGEPHVLDFGLAKTATGLGDISEDTVMPTMTGHIMGTVAYMSPEQAAGRSDLIDVRTDVYSLGIVLYQMVTGKFPYDITGLAVEVLHNIQYADPIRPRQIISRFDSDVEAIILKCLAKDPNQRYSSAAGLRDDVQRWLEGLPIVAKSISSIYLLRKIVARHRYTTTVAGLLLLIVCSSAYISFYLYRRVDDARRDAEQIARQWSDESARQLALSREIAFRRFLAIWNSEDPNRIAPAEGIARLLASGSLERQGADFLLGPSGSKDIEAFRDSLPQESRWFADLIVGEAYLRDKNRAQALDAYERGYRAAKARGRMSFAESTLREYLEARLYQLQDGRVSWTPDLPPPRDEDEK
jgi:serine/threonine protein kinase